MTTQGNEQEALSADIHLLGDLLGRTIRRLAGGDVFDLVEDVRAEAKRLRSEPSVDAARALRDRLSGLGVPSLRVAGPGVQRVLRPDQPRRATRPGPGIEGSGDARRPGPPVGDARGERWRP